MALIIECWSELAAGRRPPDFQFHYKVWDFVLLTGLKEGWLPRGTKPDPFYLSEWTRRGFQPGYKAEEFCFARMVDREDALALADALDRFLAEQFRYWGSRDRACTEWNGGMLPTVITEKPEHSEVVFAAGEIAIPTLEQAAAFFRRGGFRFCWDD